MSWDAYKISEQLWNEVDGLETYARELRGRVRRKDPRAISSQSMADRISGETAFLRQVASSANLISRADFVAELQGLLDEGDLLPPPTEVKDPELHHQGWKLKCQALIARFSKQE